MSTTLRDLNTARKMAHHAYQGVYRTEYYFGPWYRFTLLTPDGELRWVNIQTGEITQYRPRVGLREDDNG